MSASAFPYSQVIVIGGTGQLGRRLLELLDEHEGVKLVATSRSGAAPGAGVPARVSWTALDLAAADEELEGRLAALEKLLRAKAPTALVLAGALTNVEACETDPALCERVNVRNTEAVLSWARARLGAKPVFLGTDYVFDGKAGPYSEEAQRSPLSGYGRAKAAVEEWLEREAPEALIVRTTGVFDYLPGSKNFLMQLLELWSAGRPARVASDQFANPAWARDVARAVLELLGRDERGLFHAAGATWLGRADFARAAARAFGYDEQLVQAIATADLGQKARRPLRGGLSCAKLRQTIGWAPSGALGVLESLKWQHRR